LEPKHPPWATSARSKRIPKWYMDVFWVPILKCSSVVLLWVAVSCSRPHM
jgi:hypothetical protein